MSNFILLDVKRQLGVADEEVAFDEQLIVLINSALESLRTIGATLTPALSIVSKTDTWEDVFLLDTLHIPLIKVYVALKTRVIFDPPASATVMEAYSNLLKEYEWKLFVANDKPASTQEGL